VISGGPRRTAVTLVVLFSAGLRMQTMGAREKPPADEPVAPLRLADTGLYADWTAGRIDPRNRPFAPQYPLWSDGAAKKRWVYLPAGKTVDITRLDSWVFPVGTRFWKEFSFQGRKVETRLLWNASPTRWITASYVWNEAGTDAVLAPESGVRGVVEVAPGRRHSIPAAVDCAACHGATSTRPLGFNALQLSDDRDPNAIHQERLEPGMLTLAALMSEGLASPARPELTQAPPRIVTERPDTRSVLGYMSSNCGSCHNGADDLAPPAPVLRLRDLLKDGDAVARQLIGHPTRWQVPGTAEGTSVLLDPVSPRNSALLVRMRSRRPSSQMPPLGTVVRDDAAIDTMTRWLDGVRSLFSPPSSNQ
jgi:hypothetical protein